MTTTPKATGAVSAALGGALIAVHLGVLALAERLEGVVERPGGGTLPGLEGALLHGAKIDALVWRGEVWRLVSSGWMHHGWLHMGFNLIALALAGFYVERTVGHRGVVVVFVGSAAAGAVASALFTDGPSVGSSGAMFGLVGALMVCSLMGRAKVPGAASAALLPWLALNVAWGLVPGLHLDNAAHFCGWLIGGLLAAGLPDVEETGEAPTWRRWVLFGGFWSAIAAVGFAAACVARQVAICSASGATFYQCHPPAALGLGG